MASAAVLYFLCILMLAGTSGYPSGAPASQCETMEPPGHGGSAQTVKSPYNITLSSPFYNCGENLLVTLRGITGFFRGFLCQVRRDPSNYTTTVGTLVQFGTRVVMNQTCGDGRALTHSENGDKNIAEFTWTPFDDYGLVFFVCTIVQTESIYWVKDTLAIAPYSYLGSCIKTPTANLQISTKSKRSTKAASASVLRTESTDSETPSSGTSITDSTKSETYSTKSETLSASTLTTDSNRFETSSASAYTTDLTKSETTSASAYTTDSTKSETTSASTYTTDSTKSETTSASAYTTDSTKSETTSASAYKTYSTKSETTSTESETPCASTSTTDSTKSETNSTKSETPFASASTTDLTKSETTSASADATDSTKSEKISDSASTTDSRTENQTNSTGVLLTSSPSSSFHLFHKSSNIQVKSTLSIAGGVASKNPKRSKRLCRNSAENIKGYELLLFTSCYFLL